MMPGLLESGAPQIHSSSPADRLRQVLSLLGPRLAAQRRMPQRARPEISIDRLGESLQVLSPLLHRARGRGDSADIWWIAGLGHDEVRNARVLTWLLDPFGSHGAGDRFLTGLWQRISGHDKLGFALADVQRVTRENYPIGNGEHRIDIEITGARFVLFIEVKIHADESKPGQLVHYARLAARKAQSLQKPHWAVLYLSQNKVEPVENMIQFRWKDVARVIRSKSSGLDRDTFSSRLALHFADHVARFH